MLQQFTSKINKVEKAHVISDTHRNVVECTSTLNAYVIRQVLKLKISTMSDSTYYIIIIIIII